MAKEEIILDEDGASLAIRKFKQNPFLTIGMAGFFATVALGAYKFKTRPKGMSPALYIVQLRVAAQSVAIGSLAAGMIYGMLNRYVLNKPENSSKH